MPVQIPTMEESLAQIIRLPEDIKFIREKEGIGRTQLARSIGVSRVEIWHWEKGGRVPKEPLIAISLIAWAKRLRNEEQ